MKVLFIVIGIIILITSIIALRVFFGQCRPLCPATPAAQG